MSMNATNATARSLALPAAVMGFSGFVYLMFTPNTFFVAGNARATVEAIAARDLLYRLCVLSGLVSAVAFLFYALALYAAFKNVDRKQATLLLALVAVSAAIQTANLVNDLAPLVLISGSSFSSTFTQQQLDTLAMGFMRLRSVGIHLISAYWGLWLFPFGVLVWKSGVIPRAIGICLMVGGVSYVAMSLTGIVFPAYTATMARIVLPFYALGEVPIFAWLLIKGGKVSLPFSRSVRALASA